MTTYLAGRLVCQKNDIVSVIFYIVSRKGLEFLKIFSRQNFRVNVLKLSLSFKYYIKIRGKLKFPPTHTPKFVQTPI